MARFVFSAFSPRRDAKGVGVCASVFLAVTSRGDSLGEKRAGWEARIGAIGGTDGAAFDGAAIKASVGGSASR